MNEDVSATSVAPGIPFVDLSVLTLARLVMNMAQRMVYPFLPEISRGLGVSIESSRLLVSARSAAGFASPLFGPISDRFGRRTMMLIGMALFVLSLTLIPLAPVFGIALVAFLLFGLAKAIYDPALQAYVGDRVSYRERGRAIGITELAWSGSLLLGAPIIGLSIRRFGWSAPFIGLTVLAALLFGAILLFVKPIGTIQKTIVFSGNGLLHAWHILRNSPFALGGLALSFLIHVANETVFVVYGEWMEGSFGLEVQVLGLLTGIIAVAELCGELITLFGSDRIGKRRLVLVGTTITALTYLALPWLNHNLVLALGMLFVMFLTWEMSVVATISLVSELLPNARGTMMAANVAAISSGRVLGALFGSWLWGLGGLVNNGIAAAALNIIAVILVFLAISESRS